MTTLQKAAWIRRTIVACLIGGAIAGGLLLVEIEAPPKETPEAATPKKVKEGLQVTPENIAAIKASPGRLTVINTTLENHPDSEELLGILKRLKKDKYGDRVTVAELDASGQPELATSEGVDPAGFAGRLDFHKDGRHVGDLTGETDPEIVESTIDRYLESGINRVRKGWLPAVRGLERK